MKEYTITMHGFSKTKPLVFCATFAALCMIATAYLAIPLPASGYFNAGDVFVLLAGWCLGPLYGSVAAAVGSSLADILAGYGTYAPATFLIKGGVALLGYFLWTVCKKLLKKDSLDFARRGIAALLAELFMVAGYFCFESLLAGTFAAAIPNILGNCTQGVCCSILGVLLCVSLRKIKRLHTLFPALYEE